MENNLVIKALGPLEVRSNERLMDLGNSRKTRALFAILALEVAPIRRDKLCNFLWDGPDDPRGALRWSLSKLRSALGEDRDVLLATRESVTLDKTKIDCDWDQLQAVITDRDNLSTIDLLKHLDELSGGFLETLSLPKCPVFESWKLVRDEQSRRWRIQLMKALLERENIDEQKAIDVGRKLIQLGPEEESSHLALIQRLVIAGYQQEADRQLQISKEILGDLSSGANTPLLNTWRLTGNTATKPAIQKHPDKTRSVVDVHDGPSIAVIPFNDQPGAGENNYLSLGMTEDIATLLAQVPNLAVISPDSTFSYLDRRPDIKRIGAELHVRYVITGTVRKIGEDLRLTVRLVDTLTFKTLWSDNQDRPISEIFDVQDEMINGIVGSIGNELVRVEINRAKRAPQKTLNAWGIVAKAMYYYYHGFSRSSVDRAITLCHSAISMQPEYAPAHSLLAFNLAISVANEFTDNVTKASEQAIISGRLALNLEPDNALVVCHWGAVNNYLGNFELASSTLSEALELNPNSTLALAQMGRVLVCLGRGSEALEYLDRAEKLSPRDVNAYARDLYRAAANLQLDDYAAAALASEKSLARNSSWNIAWVCYALSLAALNRTGKAVEAMQTAKRLDTENTKERFLSAIAITAGNSDARRRKMEQIFNSIWDAS